MNATGGVPTPCSTGRRLAGKPHPASELIKVKEEEEGEKEEEERGGEREKGRKKNGKRKS
jgi:hypothetical protein